MKFIILITTFLVSLAFSTADRFGGGSWEGSREGRGPPGGGGFGSGGFGRWSLPCPTVTPTALSTDPFANSPWYEVQRSPSPRGFSAPSCVTYTFGPASGIVGTPAQHNLIISRKIGLTGSDLSVSIVSQTAAGSTAGTYQSWDNIHSTADTKAPSSYSVLGMDPAGPPTWVVLYWCQSGGGSFNPSNVRILTNTATPTAATLQAAQAVVTSYNIPYVNLVTVSQTGC